MRGCRIGSAKEEIDHEDLLLMLEPLIDAPSQSLDWSPSEFSDRREDALTGSHAEFGADLREDDTIQPADEQLVTSNGMAATLE